MIWVGLAVMEGERKNRFHRGEDFSNRKMKQDHDGILS